MTHKNSQVTFEGQKGTNGGKPDFFGGKGTRIDEKSQT